MTHHPAQHLRNPAQDEKRLITMDRIITTLGRDIGYASVDDAEYALHMEEGLGLSDPGLSVDGDASALAGHARTWNAYQRLSAKCDSKLHSQCDGTAWDTSIDEAVACDCECGCSAGWAGEL